MACSNFPGGHVDQRDIALALDDSAVLTVRAGIFAGRHAAHAAASALRGWIRRLEMVPVNSSHSEDGHRTRFARLAKLLD